MSKSGEPSPEASTRLGYLLKHAQLRMAELTAAALTPYGISGRELAVLLVLADRGPASQQQAAQGLGIDRTTMVALLDTLEGKALVSRHPDADDRRRNVVELTEAGHDTLRQAVKASDDAEQVLLAPLSPQAAQQLRNSLQAIVTHPRKSLARTRRLPSLVPLPGWRRPASSRSRRRCVVHPGRPGCTGRARHRRRGRSLSTPRSLA